MAVLADDQPLEAQLGKAPAPGGNPGGEHIRYGQPHRLDDLLFVEGLQIAVLGGFAGLGRGGMVMRRANKNLRHAIFLLADGLHVFAGEDRQIHGDKGEAFAVDFQHQAPGVHGVVERLIRNRSDAHFGGAGQELSRRAERRPVKVKWRRARAPQQGVLVGFMKLRSNPSFSRVHIWLLRAAYQDLVAEQSEFGVPLHMVSLNRNSSMDSFRDRTSLLPRRIEHQGRSQSYAPHLLTACGPLTCEAGPRKLCRAPPKALTCVSRVHHEAVRQNRHRELKPLYTLAKSDLAV